VKARLQKFLSIFKMELEETMEDLNNLLDIYRHWAEKHDITNYVFQENSSLVQAEIAALHSMFKLVDSFRAENYQTLEALVEDVLSRFKSEIKHKGYPQALYVLLERKVQKVVKYISLEQN